METKWHRAMKGGISEVFETMFIVPVELGEDEVDALPFSYNSSISLTRDDQQRIDIDFRATESFVRTIAANFLWVDEDEVRKDELVDVMREMVNMVGGDYMPRMGSEGWRLGLPSLELSSAGNGRPAVGLSLWCLGEGGDCAVPAQLLKRKPISVTVSPESAFSISK